MTGGAEVAVVGFVDAVVVEFCFFAMGARLKEGELAGDTRRHRRPGKARQSITFCMNVPERGIVTFWSK